MMATIEAPSMSEETREQTLKEFVWLDALHRLVYMLIDDDNKGPLSELLSGEERLVQIHVCDGVNMLGQEECSDLWPAHLGELDKNPEFLAADEQGRLL